MRIYIGGPMRGYPDFNFPAFDEAAGRLREAGHVVSNPAEVDRDLGFDETKNDLSEFNVEEAMHRDFKAILDCEAIVLLPGWRESVGARSEAFVAETTGRALFQYVGGEYVLMAPLYETGITIDYPEAGADTWIDRSPGEVRVTNPDTGGAKGSKAARFDLLPPAPLWEVAELYAAGASKYADRNWEKGYAWSLSFAALMRHAWQFWDGEKVDPETQKHHMASVVFHAFALMQYGITHPELDDRPAA